MTYPQLELSVLIATRNRARLLGPTLASLARQEMNGLRWEVIVIDNNSTDDTPQIVEQARRTLPLVSLFESEPGKNRALNQGLQVAKGQLLVFTDDDGTHSNRWLVDLYQAAQRWPDFDIFCGPIEPTYPPETPAWLKEELFTSTAFSKFPPVWIPPMTEEAPFEYRNILPFGPNFAVRRTAMEGVRFDPQMGPQGKSYPMGGETEFLQRLRARGCQIIYVPTAQVSHNVDAGQVSFDWLFRRAFLYGRGRARMDSEPALLQIFNVPVRHWLRLPLAWIQCGLSWFQTPARRFQAGVRYHRLRGEVYEYRQLASERNSEVAKS